MKLREIYGKIDAAYPKSMSDGYVAAYGGHDNSGLLIAQGREGSGALFSLVFSPGGLGPAEEGGWPRSPARCWWFFWDRQQDQDTPLDERHSWNYTAALYDGDTCTLYYLEFDT